MKYGKRIERTVKLLTAALCRRCGNEFEKEVGSHAKACPTCREQMARCAGHTPSTAQQDAQIARCRAAVGLRPLDQDGRVEPPPYEEPPATMAEAQARYGRC